MSRLIDADALIADCQLAQKQADRHGREFANAFYSGGGEISTEWWCVEDMIDNAPTIEERKTEWIPIKWHDCTDADREKYGFSDDIVAVFDCEMPDDDQAILVTTSHGYVNQDVCYIDDGFYLDSGFDWIDDITAWMPLPAPYQGEGE